MKPERIAELRQYEVKHWQSGLMEALDALEEQAEEIKRLEARLESVTVEVADGVRVGIGDAVFQRDSFQPKKIIQSYTITGSCMGSLGDITKEIKYPFYSTEEAVKASEDKQGE